MTPDRPIASNLPALETHVAETIRDLGPLQAFHRLVAENDALIRQPDVGNGRLIASARAAIYTGLVRHWAATQHRAFGYARPFAVAALGGTGRAEMAPRSDNDFAFLFDDALDENPFLLELQRQVLHSDEFEKQHGFACHALPFNLDDVSRLADKQLNAFVDLRAVYDPDGLTNRFRERIRSTFDPFEHFLHVRGFWKGQWEKAASEFERLDRFDIKNDGLRVFLAGIWTLAGKHFIHSHEVYQTLDDPQDLQAYDLLLRIRSFIHLRRSGPGRPSGGGNHPEDVLTFGDFTAFGELLGPEADELSRFEFDHEVRARLLVARRRVARFTKGIIQRELKDGRAVSARNPIIYGVGGLYHAGSSECRSPEEKSRAAFALLLASQRYGVPIDPAELQTTFRNAGEWLCRVPELSALFYEQRGSLADSFAFLSQFDGAEDRLFPGYAKFESSLDDRVMTERKLLRSALERQKMRFLEQYVREGSEMLARAVSQEQTTDFMQGVSVPVEAALLDADHLAAIKLALKTKRLPLTPDDVLLRQDSARHWHERYSTGLSDIPLAVYYEPYHAQCDFTPETVRIAQFLVANRRAFKELARTGINDVIQVREFARLCKTEQRLRALFVFTCVDRTEWGSEKHDPSRWFNSRELYWKTMMRFKPGLNPIRSLETAGYAPDQLAILKDFGEDFFAGVYRRYANRFGAHLVHLAQTPESTEPKVSLLRDGLSTILGVATRDYRGLAAAISGALWHENIPLRQAHLFSAMHHGLALDFFHVIPGEKPLGAGVARTVEQAIQRRLYIADGDESNLPRLTGRPLLQEWRPGQYCLRYEMPENVPGLIYALTYKVFRHLRGNIFGLAGQAGQDAVYVAVYLNLPPDLSFEQAAQIVKERFS